MVKLRTKFPKATYNKSDSPEIEDDDIKLNDKLSIQILYLGAMCIVESLDDGCIKFSKDFHTEKDILNQLKID